VHVSGSFVDYLVRDTLISKRSMPITYLKIIAMLAVTQLFTIEPNKVQGQADDYDLRTYSLLGLFSSIHVAILRKVANSLKHHSPPSRNSNNAIDSCA